MSSRLWMQQLGMVVAMFALCVAVVGCGGNKVTKENADKIKTDMTEAQVKEILGPPTETAKDEVKVGDATMKAPGLTFYVYKSGSKSITVTMKDGKVVNSTPLGF